MQNHAWPVMFTMLAFCNRNSEPRPSASHRITCSWVTSRQCLGRSLRRQMALSAVIILYVFFCFLVGLCGRDRRMGFFVTFILSFIFTPLLVLIVLLLTAP